VKKSVLILFVVFRLVASCQNSGLVVDTVKANGLSYIGCSINGIYVGLWSGRDSLSDSVHVYARFKNGRLQETYAVHPMQGLLVTNRLNMTQDTLSIFMYGRDGAPLLRVEYLVSDTSKWRTNSFSPGTTNGESGLKSVRRWEWYYDYEGISGFTLIQEVNDSSANYAHYYLNGKFVCTFRDGKFLWGDKHWYNYILKSRK